MRILSTLIIAIICTSSLFSQPIRKAKYNEMIRTAQECKDTGKWANAAEWYEKAYDESEDKSLVIQIANMYYNIRDYKRAGNWMKRILRRDKDNKYVEQRFLYGQIFKAQGKYEEAIEQFQLFIKDSKQEDKIEQAIVELQGIELLNTMDQNVNISIEILNKSVNSASAEHGPAVYRDGTLYYSSFNRKDEIVIGDTDDDFYAKIYSAGEGKDGGYGKGKALPELVNRAEFHNTNPSFTEDGRAMYFTRVRYNGNVPELSLIYVSYRRDNGWSPAVEVGILNGEWINKHPSPGELYGNDVLFFSSNREGGYGGYDIYYSEIKSDGSFKNPVNLGESINTAGDDITPFYQDGNLYLSTNGRPTIGGYDLFKSTWDGVSWSEVENLGSGYNSSYDDMDLTFNQDQSKAYLVSNRYDENKKTLRSKTCCDDIYEININQIVIDLVATVMDDNGPLNGASLTLKDETELDNIGTDTKSLPNNNVFQFGLKPDHSYVLITSKKGYYSDTLDFNTVGFLDDYTVKKKVTLQPLPPELAGGDGGDGDNSNGDDGSGIREELVAINQPIRLNNIYYDYDDDKILKDAELDLKLLFDLMNEYPDMVIELSSHTDARGPDDYNESLSQRRANSAKTWLTNKGIASNRIKPKGYGEQKIINQCKNDIECSDDEHRRNRRTEFKILEGPRVITIKRNVQKTKEYNGGKQSLLNVPIIQFEEQHQQIGRLKRGDKKQLVYNFKNVGTEDLLIEIVTSCKCTELEYSTEPIKPGEASQIKAVFDSSDMKLGELTKVIDIISNTEPLVVEAKFTVFIEE